MVGKTHQFSFGREQYSFCKGLADVDSFINISQAIGRVIIFLGGTINIPKMLRSVLRKRIFLLEGISIRRDLKEKTTLQYIKEDRKIKINPNVISFLNIAGQWFKGNISFRWLDVGKSQIKFLDELSKEEEFITIGKAFANTIHKYNCTFDLNRVITSLFKKRFILFENVVLENSNKITATIIKRFIENNKKLKINPDLTPFIKIVKYWFEI